MEDFFLNIVYKNKSVKFRVTNPEAPLATLMTNLRHAIGQDGRLIFDFPSIDDSGAPLDYFFGKEDHALAKPTRRWPTTTSTTAILSTSFQTHSRDKRTR